MLEAVFFRRPGLLAGSRTGPSLACEAITTSAVVPPARWTADRAVVVQLRGDRDLTVAEDGGCFINPGPLDLLTMASEADLA
jgi:hypothetical protein